MSDDYRVEFLDEDDNELTGDDAEQRAHRVRYWGGPVAADDRLAFEFTVAEDGCGNRDWQVTRLGSYQQPFEGALYSSLDAAVRDLSKD
jgi:hypothetical protein